jgi:hypothetical protein
MRNARCLVFCIVLGLILSGCGVLPWRSSDDETPSAPTTTPQPVTATPRDTDSPKKPLEDEPPIIKPDPDTLGEDLEIPDKPLSRDGPWWVFSTPEGLFAVNPDGSGLTQFFFGGDNAPLARQILVSPDASHLAYLVGEGFDATLRINQFPWLTLITEKPLLSFSSDLDLEAMRAVVEQSSLAFSPDGRFLAFMGAIEGPSSDLYLFSLDTFEVTRLTDGPSQAFQPVWSLDGKYIVHTGVRSFGTGAGYDMSGVWASRADNADAITLYDPSGSGSEVILGWLDDQTFIVYSWGPLCGSHLLRTFNIESQQSAILWKESFQAIAYNPSDKVVLLTSNEGECSPEAGAGMYFVPTNGNAPIRILETTGPQIIWSEKARLFLASGDFGAGVIAVDSKGQFIDLDMPQGARAFPAVAPGSRDLAWKGDSLWVGPLLGSLDNPPKAIFNESVHTVTWTPNGESVIFFAESGLYIAHQPDYTPIRIADGLDNQNGVAEWVTP